jgi:hypothetical protein
VVDVVVAAAATAVAASAAACAAFAAASSATGGAAVVVVVVIVVVVTIGRGDRRRRRLRRVGLEVAVEESAADWARRGRRGGGGDGDTRQATWSCRRAAATVERARAQSSYSTESSHVWAGLLATRPTTRVARCTQRKLARLARLVIGRLVLVLRRLVRGSLVKLAPVRTRRETCDDGTLRLARYRR